MLEYYSIILLSMVIFNSLDSKVDKVKDVKCLLFKVKDYEIEICFKV